MEKQPVYIDHNATTPLDTRVLEVMLPYMTHQFYNASSIYFPAQKVREELEQARVIVARLLNTQKHNIFFTSGGTESDNFAIIGAALANQKKGKHIITTKIEHPGVIKAFQYLEKMGFEATYVNVDDDGIVKLDELKNAFRKDTILISVMYANNETGVIQPIQEITELLKERSVIFHTDAVQVAGKMEIDLEKTKVDLLSLSAHKFYGPKGAGVLYVRNGIKIDPFIHGGEQEQRKRAGTENVAGIIGLAKAFELANANWKEEWEREKKLRDKLEKGILERIPDVKINGHPDKRLANTLNISIKYVEGEALLMYLSDEGIYASSGSACSSGSLEPSHVLLAMGLSHEIAHGSVRFSLGRSNTEEEIDRILNILPDIVKRLRQFSPFGRGKDDFSAMEGNFDHHHHE